MDHREVCELLQQTIVEFCRQNVSSWCNDIEVDGIICISPKNSSTHHVVKIHERLQPTVPDQEMQDKFQLCDMKSRLGDPLSLDMNIKQSIVHDPCAYNKTKSPNQIKDITSNVSEMMNGDVAIISLENSTELEGDNCSEYLEDGHFSRKDSEETISVANKNEKCNSKQVRKSNPSHFLPQTNENKSPVTESLSKRTSVLFQPENINTSEMNSKRDSQEWNAIENSSSGFLKESFSIKKETVESTQFDIHCAQPNNTSLRMDKFSEPTCTFLPNNIQHSNSYQFSPSFSREHSCRFCGKQFSFKCTKVRHERNSCGKTIQTMYSCEVCEKVFSRSDSRVRHMMKAHGVMSPNAMARKNKTNSSF
ncbi:zinc finger protein 263-like [Saccostrea cucullata]|uniref:zinc finger protein 263-like n=1 Tax=Saccostrea cuccullata TaxID=36930 RepID=UPI002ED472AB